MIVLMSQCYLSCSVLYSSSCSSELSVVTDALDVMACCWSLAVADPEVWQGGFTVVKQIP